MMYESITTLIFRWLDVVVIASGSIYGIKRWVIPFLKEERKRERERWADLEHKVAMHTREVHQLDKHIDYDTVYAAQLQQKVILWQAVCNQEKRAQIHAQELFMAHLQEQQHNKSRYIATLSHDRRVSVQALEQAEVALRNRFKEPQIAQKELHRAVARLKERVT